MDSIISLEGPTVLDCCSSAEGGLTLRQETSDSIYEGEEDGAIL